MNIMDSMHHDIMKQTRSLYARANRSQISTCFVKYKTVYTDIWLSALEYDVPVNFTGTYRTPELTVNTQQITSCL